MQVGTWSPTSPTRSIQQERSTPTHIIRIIFSTPQYPSDFYRQSNPSTTVVPARNLSPNRQNDRTRQEESHGPTTQFRHTSIIKAYKITGKWDINARCWRGRRCWLRIDAGGTLSKTNGMGQSSVLNHQALIESRRECAGGDTSRLSSCLNIHLSQHYDSTPIYI